MLDIKFIRDNPEKVETACKKKQVKVDIDALLDIDKKRRELLQGIEQIRAQKNEASDKISKSKLDSEKKGIILKMKELDKKGERIEKSFNILAKEFDDSMLQIPNIPFDDVPVGKDDAGNVVMRKVGEKPKFEFKFKNYLELAENLDLIDVKRAAKTSGSRFGFIKREAVFIEFALINFVFENLTKKGFVPVVPPVMLKENMARGTGYFEASDRKEAYFLPEDNLYLVGTSEQSLLAMHADEILEEKELPKRYLGFSTCFRREAGAYGKDTKGILRVHQFDKIEMLSFCQPEKSKEEHEFLLSLEEELMQSLGIPYHVVNICTGDLGRPAAAKYDLEAWIPSENRYRETHSTSNCTDFQARRLNIRFRDKTGKLDFVHTLNGTAFAIGRILIAIIENFQQKDGSILIPEVLQKYLPFKEIHSVK
jgi:seryl-tRNA synthetase